MNATSDILLTLDRQEIGTAWLLAWLTDWMLESTVDLALIDTR